MDKVVAIVTASLATVVAIATALLGFTVPGIWTLQSDMGATKVTLAAIEKRLGSMEEKLDDFGKKLGSIDRQLTTQNTDPAVILAKSGVGFEPSVGTVRVGDRLVGFPKTPKSLADLQKWGLKQEAITPALTGFVMGTFDKDDNLKWAANPLGPKQFDRLQQ